MRFYTIGYAGRNPPDFLDLLTARGIRTVVDVRLRPDHAILGSYVRSKSPEKGIVRLLHSRGIDYVSRVDLGNPFLEFHDWPQRYRRLIDLAGDLLLEGLTELAEPICLLCAERRAADCHRRLIAAALVRRGHEVEHIE